MIDPKKVKAFWEARAATYGLVPFASIANLEQNPENLKRKVRDETTKIFSWLPNLTGLSVLDLGAGVGQWAFRFAEHGARRVLAVEYAAPLVEIGKAEAERRGLGQVSFHISAAEEFDTDRSFDIVYISGLFVYLNDVQADRLLSKLNKFVCNGGVLMVRDGTSTHGRYEIRDRISTHLGTYYSAIYRTVSDYIDSIQKCGFQLVRSENMFPEGHPLNKYPETRLHVFLFRKPA